MDQVRSAYNSSAAWTEGGGTRSGATSSAALKNMSGQNRKPQTVGDKKFSR